ncbi:MAG: type IV pilus modification protein PilV [Pseudomonadales bacterium]|nr:type IV pilus modification protein PilV [Pseudomonadales bacterium]
MNKSKGMSLIEVLVAILVFAVGIVGFAALQLKSVRQVEETYSRSQAMSIAHDFIERARANFSEESKAYYETASSWSGQLNDPGSCVVTGETPENADACTSRKMAEADVYEVRTSASNLLLNGSIGFAECDSVYCVTVAWGETSLADCDQDSFADGERQSDSHCIKVEFIP